jgi:UDP-N-acetylglucosamine 2-epimerase
MLDQALAAFGIKADVELAVMSTNQSLAALTGSLLRELDAVYTHENPDAVIVQGDTTSTLVGTLAAFYRSIPVAHVEAGLRTGDMRAPFPEEANRVIVSRLASWHFTPTPRWREQLIKEGAPPDRIEVTGNTIVDALNWMRAAGKISADGQVPGDVLAALEGHRMLLVTGHRRESFGGGLPNICRALRILADRFADVQVIYPVHLNPNVQQPVHELLKGHPRIHLLPPVSHPAMLWLMERAHLVLSDSGGVQEEAPSFSKPLLILRETTERPEAVEAGCAVLAGTGESSIVAHASRLLEDGGAYRSMTGKANPFGDGSAAERIVARLRTALT